MKASLKPLGLPAVRGAGVPLSEQLKLQKGERDSAVLAEVADIIELTANQAVGAVGSDYWVHRNSLPVITASRSLLSTARA